jgi:hypothetical protein
MTSEGSHRVRRDIRRDPTGGSAQKTGPEPIRSGHLPVEFLDARRIDFAELPAPVLSPWERGEVDRLWAETKARNPAAFDGPLVASLGVDPPPSAG